MGDMIGEARLKPTYIGLKAKKNTGAVFEPPSYFSGDIPQHPSIFFWGWAAYHDTFPKTPMHIGEFCETLLGVDPPDPNMPGSLIKLAWGECEHHNCADDDCEDYQLVVDTLQKIPVGHN
jgi:hypothetical protein